VFILDSLSNYTPKDDREAQSICERITPRLAHANAAVVLSAVKVSPAFPIQCCGSGSGSVVPIHMFLGLPDPNPSIIKQKQLEKH
jgi:hypothetical protein